MTTEQGRARADTRPTRWGVPLAAAILVCAVLGLAAYAKFMHPLTARKFLGTNLSEDTVVASAELVMIVAILALHRLRQLWSAVAIFFGGLAGYAIYYSFVRETSCGCFGTLIELPKGASFAMDVGFVVLSLAVAWWLGASRGLLLGTLAAVPVATGVGFLYAQSFAPPEASDRSLLIDDAPVAETPEEAGEGDGAESAEDPAADGPPARPDLVRVFATPMEKLLASDEYAELRTSPPVWYVFIWDPDCHVCEELKLVAFDPAMQRFGPDNPDFRVVQIKKQDLDPDPTNPGPAIVDYWAWDGSPTAFLVEDGVITFVSRNEETAFPEDVYTDWASGTLETNFTMTPPELVPRDELR